ncbi:hypothetical protein K2O51_12510 [Cupriavidus pinatubonensis]|uniref:hypothetical protein n=1 Tax=Cupriavidus pinatubonensis TaxID=248026 RepID=UPI001C737179|nr:hypothetical protein [Cupriavidus pinatubonensis]QYY31651.1 hypothetical protein K2O51_12510 [Cupriavidus pinatubonensis]
MQSVLHGAIQITFMKTGKSVGLSFRVTPEFRTLLEAAAMRERRSLTNMLETALSEYCERYGIGPEPENAAPHGKKSNTKPEKFPC